MARRVIYGTDTLNWGRTKINANFSELYARPVGGGGGGYDLAAGATAAQINTALASNSAVRLAPGDYRLWGGVSIPAGKALVGSRATRLFGTNNPLVSLNSGSLLEGLTVEGTASTGSQVSLTFSQ